ncbi:MAG: epimerase [Halobacteriovorax sp.]|nr:epimerase [Halobacteriovorax sp.]|tara:strand:+ start:4309 stop:4986 length:678 start_codon:yes stop_codon:yes gene_type:complete
MKISKKVLVIGASGGSGRKTVEALLGEGHKVTALSRSASKVFGKEVRTIDGSALDKNTLREAMKGQEVVIITLGISENPFRVRFFGPSKTPMNIRSEGTRLAIEVMKELNIKRLLVQTTYGSGPSKNNLRLVDKLFFTLLLKPQIKDTEKQDKYIRESGLDWTISQPVHLNDSKEACGLLHTSNNNQVSQWQVSRRLVGNFLAKSISDHSTLRQTIAVSQKKLFA